MIGILALLAIFAGQALLSLRQKAVTTDELMYIAAGYYHLQTGRFDLNMTNPPLLKVLSALPLALLQPDLPSIEGNPADLREIGQWQFARQFLYDNRVDADRLLFAARLPFVLLGIILGFFVFHWSRQLYGTRAGLFALFLYTFSPNMLAHTRLATQDLGLALFFFLTCYYLWRFSIEPRARNLLAYGLSLSAAVLSKTTAIFLIPISGVFLIVLLLRGKGEGIWLGLPLVRRLDPAHVRRRQLVSFAGSVVVVGAIGLVVVNLGYLYEGTFRPISGTEAGGIDRARLERLYQRLPLDNAATRRLVDLAIETPLPLPRPFLEMLRFQTTRVRGGNDVYFAGETSREGWWYLMFVAFALKTPLPILVLIATAAVVRVRSGALTSAEWLIVIAVAVLFALFSILKSVNVGLRYILPIYPLLHVWVSSLLRDRITLLAWQKWGILILAMWYTLGTLRIHPHYLAYFNELIGPQRAYLYLADSNLDWGQDLKALRKYMEDHGIRKIRLAYFGSADARYYGIDYEYLPSVGLAPVAAEDRWWYEVNWDDLPPLSLEGAPIAISATLLAGVFSGDYYRELFEKEPTDQVGYSIMIFDLR